MSRKTNMSGHSKWAQIKRQKGATDVKRGAAFTKLANIITIAVKSGGGISDPNQNFKLRLAIEKAREANMPKENIERAVRRAEGKQEDTLEEVTYEGYGPGGIAVLVETATDNRARTVAEIKHLFEGGGGTLASPGAVSFQFKAVGKIEALAPGSVSSDEAQLMAIDVGVEDIEEHSGVFTFYTAPEALVLVRHKLEAAAFSIQSAELSMDPLVPFMVSDPETVRRALSFINKIEENESVQKVFTNLVNR